MPSVCFKLCVMCVKKAEIGVRIRATRSRNGRFLIIWSGYDFSWRKTCCAGHGPQNRVPLQAPADDLAYDAALQLGLLNHRLNLLAHEEESRQLSLPNITLNNLVNRIPCSCDTGLCKCCAGFLAVIGMNSCTEVAYRPDEFSFELRMRVNNNIWFRRKVSGQNPPPFCFRPPRFNFARACIQFHDIWFVGRNMHVCMYMSGEFQGFELFERNFDCLLFGDHGVKIVPPEQSYPSRPNGVDIDEGDDEIEDYDENVVRSLAEKMMG
ncbi:uncharacterized protein [Drosophila pseudoobscura]|uniref:Uncharacterized protein isoform X1 n=1 Tax=Drosophila pseudoobscura pseudoobscura TaxID=46245 RepID=A0A6I8VU09_DROPS|nr:uncharacterized protein LOC6898564 isoform X1 [Drosophila pseudoobscura]